MDEDPYATRLPGRGKPAPAEDSASTLPPPADSTIARGRAAAGRPAAPPAAAARPALPDRTIPPTIPRLPGGRRGRTGAIGVVAALVVVAGAGFAAGWFAHGGSRGRANPPPAPSPFVVTALSVHLAPGALHCPSAVAHLSGTMTVDHGGGTITYQWSLPGKASTAPATVTVPPSQRAGVATLAYTLSGNGALDGFARLHVISPLAAYSAPVPLHYTCASKPKK